MKTRNLSSLQYILFTVSGNCCSLLFSADVLAYADFCFKNYTEDREILPNDITQPDLTNYISAVNMAISPFDLEIRSTVQQTSQTRVYALVNTTSDPLTQLATTYTADEIAYVKRLLDAMFERNNTRRQEAMVVPEMQAVQLAKVTSNRTSGETQTQTQTQSGGGGSGQSLTLKDAESMLAKLVDEGWFEKSRKGNYMLSPRALMELKGWLVSTYNDEEDEDRSAHPRARGGKIKMCFACGDVITMVSLFSDCVRICFVDALADWIVLQGQRCSNRHCAVRIHDICTRNFFRVQQTEQCPVCKTDWTGDNYVGEKAMTSNRQSGARTSNSNTGASNLGQSATAQVDAADEDSDSG